MTQEIIWGHAPNRRDDDGPVDDEHAWDTYLNNAPMGRHFPVEFPSGTVVDQSVFRCVHCRGALPDVRGRVRKTAPAAVIAAAGMCPDCNDVTGCDVRIRSDGRIEALHGHGVATYAASIRVPLRVLDPDTGEPVMTCPHAQDLPDGDSTDPSIPQRPWLARRIARLLRMWPIARAI